METTVIPNQVYSLHGSTGVRANGDLSRSRDFGLAARSVSVDIYGQDDARPSGGEGAPIPNRLPDFVTLAARCPNGGDRSVPIPGVSEVQTNIVPPPEVVFGGDWSAHRSKVGVPRSNNGWAKATAQGPLEHPFKAAMPAGDLKKRLVTGAIIVPLGGTTPDVGFKDYILSISKLGHHFVHGAEGGGIGFSPFTVDHVPIPSRSRVNL